MPLLPDAPAAIPAWLAEPLHALAEAGAPNQALAAQLSATVRAVDAVERLYTARFEEVERWFHTPEAEGHTLAAALPCWSEAILGQAGSLLRSRLLPELAGAGFKVLPVVQVDEWQRAWLHRYFMERVYPLLTPLAVDPGRPFPFISSDSLNLLVELRRPEDARLPRSMRAELFARVKIPPSTPRLVAVPAQPGLPSGEGQLFVNSTDLVRFFVHHLFTNMPVRHVYPFRLVRGDGRSEGRQPAGVRANGRQRRQIDRPVVRLDVERRMAEPVLTWLVEHLQVPAHAVVRHEGLLECVGLPYLAAQIDARAESALPVAL
jgi:polyphosphate kinase